MSFLHILKFLTNMPEVFIDKIPFLPDFIKDALADSLNLVPFLFLMFLFIEILEQFFTKKKHLVVFFMKKIGPFFGSLFASIPQCGFSVIASTLYTKRILSRGTLMAVYLATSDEAIPVLLSNPSMINVVLPIILLKIFIAILVGYFVDYLISYIPQNYELNNQELVNEKITAQGCCHHHFSQTVKSKEILLHPIKHTFNIFLFILFISIVLGALIDKCGTQEKLAKLFLMNTPIQPIIVSLVGLIPNCAISVMLTMLFIKHTISLGSLIAGLSSSGGLGLLILLTKNGDKKDTFMIISLMVIISSIIGLIIQYNVFNINYFFSLFGVI